MFSEYFCAYIPCSIVGRDGFITAEAVCGLSLLGKHIVEHTCDINMHCNMKIKQLIIRCLYSDTLI